MSVLRDVLILADIAGGTEIWNKGTRPRNMSSSPLLPLFSLSFPLLLSFRAIHLLRVLFNSSLESRLLPWQHRYGTLKTSPKATGQERDGGKRKDSSPSRPLPASSRCPSSAISSPSSASSVSPIRCSKKSIRLSLPTRFQRLLFLRHGPASPRCFLSRFQRDTLRHTLRGEVLQ